MNRKNVLGFLAILAVIASIGSVAALGGKFPSLDPQAQDKITNAIKANDYNAWKEAISAQLTQDNFNKIVQRYQAMLQRHGNETRGMVSGNQTLNAEMIQALKDGNYDAWKKAVANSKSPLVSKITNEDQFKTLVQLYQAKQDGNYTKVNELSQQLGLPMGFGRHKMHGHFGR